MIERRRRITKHPFGPAAALLVAIALLVACLLFARPVAAAVVAEVSAAPAADSIPPSTGTVTAPGGLLEDISSAAGPLDLATGLTWLYKAVQERGILVYTAKLEGGDSAPGGAIKTLTWRPGGVYELATIAIGADFGRDGAQDNPVTLKDLSPHIGTPFNLVTAVQPLLSSESFKRNFSWIPLPAGWEVWYGPSLVFPRGLSLKQMRLDRDLRHYLSAGKKFGGASK